MQRKTALNWQSICPKVLYYKKYEIYSISNKTEKHSVQDKTASLTFIGNSWQFLLILLDSWRLLFILVDSYRVLSILANSCQFYIFFDNVPRPQEQQLSHSNDRSTTCSRSKKMTLIQTPICLLKGSSVFIYYLNTETF